MTNKSFSQNQIPFFDHCFDKTRLKKWITKLYYESIVTEDLTILNIIEIIKDTGFQEATRAGISIGIDDLKIPEKKQHLFNQTEFDLMQTHQKLTIKKLTALENFQNFIDTWHRVSEQIKNEVVLNFEKTSTLNPVYMMAFSGARGNLSQVTQLVGMRGFMSDPEGQVIDYPIRSNFKEGLNLTEYIISCYGARKGLVDTALRTADAGYLTRRLVDVAHSIIVTSFDCHTNQGVWLTPITENAMILHPLKKRLVGRVLASNIYFPFRDKNTNALKAVLWPYFKKNQQLDPVDSQLLGSCFKRVFIRSPLRCLKNKRVCQLCYGWTLPHSHLAPIGEAVGILAAQSIGEPGTQLTMRTFHTGGVFSGGLSEEIQSPCSGQIFYIRSVKGALLRLTNGIIGFMTKEPGQLQILSEEKTQNPLILFDLSFPEDSILFLKQGESVQLGQKLIELPKEFSSDQQKETILNTYTYYSNHSGLIKLNKVNIDPYQNQKPIQIVGTMQNNSFCEKAQYKNLKIHSFTIYSGQIYKTNIFQNILPKPGDLINNNSILNLTQLLTTRQSNITTKINQLKLQFYQETLVFQLAIQNIKYTKKAGYFCRFSHRNTSYAIHRNTSYAIHLNLPKLTNHSLNFIHQFLFSFNKYRALRPGLIFKQKYYLNKPNSFERFIGYKSLLKFQNSSFLRAVQFHWLINEFTNLSSPFVLNQKAKSAFDFFSLPKIFYKDTLFYKNQNLKRQSYQTKGTLILVKKQNQKWTTNNTRWIKTNHLISSQFNLQNQKKTALAKRDGFLVLQKFKPIENHFHSKLKQTDNYWYTTQQFEFKIGWPYSQFHPTFQSPKTFHIFGTMTLDDILFNGKSIYTDSLFFTPKQDLKSGSNYLIYLTKRNKKFLVRRNSLFYVFQSLNKKFVLHSRFQNQKIVQLFFKNPHWNEFQNIQKYKTSKKFFLSKLFQQLNRQEKVPHLLSKKPILQFYSYFLNWRQFYSKKNQNSISSYYIKKQHNFLQCRFIYNQPKLQNITSILNWERPFDLTYDFKLSTSLNHQNSFKNNPWFKNIYISDKKKVWNLPLIQSHVLSSHNGEILINKMTPDLMTDPFGSTLKDRSGGFFSVLPGTKYCSHGMSSLVLTNNDTYVLKMDYKNFNGRLLNYFFLGNKISNKETVPLPGQVIHITKSHLKFQKIETALIAATSKVFCQNQELLEKQSRIFTQSYPRLQMGDIVQGIPKIEEFFEARQTKEGKPFENNLHNLLKKRFHFYKNVSRYPLFLAVRKSIYDIQNYIIHSIFKLYSSQGITISDKHLEIIVRQMTSKVKVIRFWKQGTALIPFKHPLPGEFYPTHYIERYQYRKKNTRTYNVEYVPIVLGITKAALENDGFISAASFQETTRILSRGAIFHKKDYLKGLKENVILGHIIPAGTAVRTYSRHFKSPILYNSLTNQTLKVLTINYQSKKHIFDRNLYPIHYLNPIRYSILRILFYEFTQNYE